MLYIVLTQDGRKEVFFDRESAYIYYATNKGVSMTEKHATQYYNSLTA